MEDILDPLNTYAGIHLTGTGFIYAAAAAAASTLGTVVRLRRGMTSSPPHAFFCAGWREIKTKTVDPVALSRGRCGGS